MRVTVEDVWAERWKDTSQRLWIRVYSYAVANAGPTGHAPLTTGELARQLDTDPHSISRAISAVVREGWLHRSSCARCLVLQHADPLAPCRATHRDGL